MTLAIFLVPIMVGLAGTVAPAFGILPSIGATQPSLAPWRALVDWPGFATALRLTLTTGALASLLSLVGAVALVAIVSQGRWFTRAQAVMTPLLASPHAAVALGLAFVIAPSGWIARAISPELTGWTRPPIDLVTVRDPYGLALVAGLLTKEIPYLAIMLAAALGQVPVKQAMESARAMGYARVTAFVKLVVPRVWPQVRLPFYAVVAYSFSVVDQALVLAPGNPPPLAVLAARWFADYDIAMYLPAAAAALAQLAIVVVAIAVCYALEWCVARAGRRWIERGGRGGALDILVPVAAAAAGLAAGLGLASLASLAVWSVAGAWSFPDAWPADWSLAGWRSSLAGLAGPLAASLGLASAATLVALPLCLGCLENEARQGRRPGGRALWLLYVPLLVPQIAFLFGVQVVLVRLSLDGTWFAVVWAHLIFVLPYVFLSLADPWRALEPRYVRSAASLGATPARVFLAVKLPMLLRPILVAAAIGVVVSIGQYLPTLFAGAGRITTITTESLTLASGGDRRTIAVYGFLQSALPLAAYALAILIPRIAFRNRRGMT